MSIAKRILAIKQNGKSVKDFDRWFELVRSWPAGPSEGVPPLPRVCGDEPGVPPLPPQSVEVPRIGGDEPPLRQGELFD